jgi:hypothetical protein
VRSEQTRMRSSGSEALLKPYWEMVAFAFRLLSQQELADTSS